MTKVKLDNALIAVTKPQALQSSIIKGKGYRITVLTDRLIRIETSKTDKFIDDATQSVWFRNLATPKFKAQIEGKILKITTERVTFSFNTTSHTTKVTFKDGKTANCTNRENLKGTMRTLDMNFGLYSLEDGILSKSGVAVFTDSSLILTADGEVTARTTDTADKYVFAYGKDYRAAIKDFYRLTGGVPLVPRFALGNWWSRYRAYTQQEYVDLIQKFIDKDIPLTVATIDMDWHWVNINDKFGTDYKGRLMQSPGWTGYSWNTDLFPDYKGFLKWLNDKNLKVTLNLHPADGVRHYEDMYEEMAREMGVDPETKTDIPFDMTDNRFINSYFNVINHRYEEEGVRFWWIDWQQGKKTALSGLDPLWALNHYFTLDNARNYRPLILSRYSGVGSHRYPLGFSGDSFMLWSSLRKQPYFTNNAANIGYSWWSHDIGGHMFGERDDEMYLRWVQYGVFSPINRLHSSNSDLSGKEPWAYRTDVCDYASAALKLRHRMIPYLYSMNYKTYSQGRALCEPMYYTYPLEAEAYKCPNQYMFGTELIVCPIVRKIKKSTGTAGVWAWLPSGRWTDIFTGQIYSGNRRLKLFRDESSIPVLAKAGAIIPLSADSGNACTNPDKLEMLIYRGNNKFTLYEDEGEDNTYDKKFAKTDFSVKEEGNLIEFNIDAVSGDTSVIPDSRDYIFNFRDVGSGSVSVLVNGTLVSSNYFTTSPIVILNDVKPSDEVYVVISDYTIGANEAGNLAISKVIARWQGGFIKKSLLYYHVKSLISGRDYSQAVKKSILPHRIKQEILELLD